MTGTINATVIGHAWDWLPGVLVDRIIPAPIADVLRAVSMIGALVLIVGACYAIRVSEHADQRVRFGLFAAFAVMLTAGNLGNLGQAAVWRLGVLPALVALAVWSTIKYVRRELGSRRRDHP